MSRPTLCSRCQLLESVVHLFEAQRPDEIDLSRQEKIPRSSLSTECWLCVQLYSLLQACTRSADTNNTVAKLDALVLKCRYWRHPELARLVAYYRISHHGVESFVFLRLDDALPLSIVEPSLVDYQRIQRWFSSCEHHHKKCKGHMHTASGRTIQLKALNCSTREICPLPSEASYVCLSYVWGPAKDTPANGTSRPPKTIEDAMFVTKKLGFNYLWVDRYCIDQCNHEEKHHMINNMDQIYLNADFTIIAAEGDGPHAGLPGVCGTPRAHQRIIKINQFTLIAIESVLQYVQKSKWNTRGWTYQEMLLSRRVLLFTTTRVYFQCLSGFGLEGVTETIHSQRQAPGSNVLTWTEKIPGTKPVFPILRGNLRENTILERLSEYFERTLSFREDTIRAVLGVFNVLGVTDDFRLKQFYGMPVVSRTDSLGMVEQDFTERLTWVAGTNRPEHASQSNLAEEYGLRNTDLSTFTPGAELLSRTCLFPSWSWASFRADCPRYETKRGIKLIFPISHQHVKSHRSFDATNTRIKIHRRWKPSTKRRLPNWMTTDCPALRLSHFMDSCHECEDYEPQIDVKAWTWCARFSNRILKRRLDVSKFTLHLDDSQLDPETEARLTAIHVITYKSKTWHEEEKILSKSTKDENTQLQRRPSNPHERNYHIRILLVRRAGFRSYVRVGVLTVNMVWHGDRPDTVKDVLEGMIRYTAGDTGPCWRRKTLRLV